MTKKELRKEILARRNGLSLQERKGKSQQIITRVLSLDEFKKSNKVLLYAPIKSEVDTSEIFGEAKSLGKEIYYPRVIGEEMEFFAVQEWEELEVGTFGILEPKIEPKAVCKPKEEDELFILIPGAVFDKEGNRIGYGRGYYDKYLQKLEAVSSYKNICKVAAAYDCQIVALGQIQKEAHDRKADYVVTESKVHHCGKETEG